MVCCGFISSFIGLKLVVLYPCDFAVDGVKGWNGYEIDTTYKKKQKILSTSVPHSDVNYSHASQPGWSDCAIHGFCLLHYLFTLSTAS